MYKGGHLGKSTEEWTTTMIIIPWALPYKFSFLHHTLYFSVNTPQVITSSIQIHSKAIFNSLLFEFQPAIDSSVFVLVCSVTSSWCEDALGRRRAALLLLNPWCLSPRGVMDWPSGSVPCLYLPCARFECAGVLSGTYCSSSVSLRPAGSYV